jgi:putative aldouronate transport system substrate-binding protein
MLKTRKLLCLVLALAFVLASVAGCAKPTTAPAAEGAPEAAGAAGLEPVQLTWYFIGNGQQEDVALIEEKINEYIKDKINATVKLQCYQWGAEYDDKLRQMIASRQEFDICFTAAWANNYMQNAVKGAFVPLNDERDLLGKYAPKTKAMLGEDFLAGSQIDGINYAIPANKEKAHSWGFIIKKDLVDKYGFDLSTIKSLEDLEPMLKVIKEKEPNVYGLEALNGESPYKLMDWDVVGDDKCPGVVYNDSKDLVVFNEFEKPETMELLKTIRKFFLAGYIRQDAATVTDYNADEAAGKIFAATKSLKPGKDAEMSLTHGFEWTQVYITPPVISSRDTMGSLQAISSTSKNPERALMFLELFNTDPYLNNLINFGIEGKHYVKVSENVIKAGPDQAKYNPGTGWMFGNQFINYLYESEDPKKWELFEEFNQQATGTQTLGFNFDPAPVKNEIAAVNNLWDKYVPALETGSIDPEVNVPKFLAELKAAGIDKIIAEKQSQLDAWAKKMGKK